MLGYSIKSYGRGVHNEKKVMGVEDRGQKN